MFKNVEKTNRKKDNSTSKEVRFRNLSLESFEKIQDADIETNTLDVKKLQSQFLLMMTGR